MQITVYNHIINKTWHDRLLLQAKYVTDTASFTKLTTVDSAGYTFFYKPNYSTELRSICATNNTSFDKVSFSNKNTRLLRLQEHTID